MNQLDERVGISVSTPGDSELEKRGLAQDHVRHAFVEIARQILAAGGSLAYGGDLRESGYTMTLLALLRTYSRADRPENERICLYLGRPVWTDLTASARGRLAAIATPVQVPGAEEQVEGRVGRALDFTVMRKRMTEETGARIVVGGRTSGQSGRWPGIAEEAYLALRAGQPLFVAGGLGGGAACVASALRGEWPAPLTTDYQLAHTTGYAELLEAQVGVPDDELRGTFVNADLRNGLSNNENTLLYETTDLDIIVALILRGLRLTAASSRE